MPKTSRTSRWRVGRGWALAAILLVASWILWRTYTLSDPTAPGDAWAPLINAAMSAHVQLPDSFFSAVLGAPGFNDPFTQQLAAIQLRTFGVFLLATAPAAAAASFWLGLRRLREGHRSGLWADASVMSAFLLIVMLGVLAIVRALTTPGSLYHMPWWPYVYLLLTRVSWWRLWRSRLSAQGSERSSRGCSRAGRRFPPESDGRSREGFGFRCS